MYRLVVLAALGAMACQTDSSETDAVDGTDTMDGTDTEFGSDADSDTEVPDLVMVDADGNEYATVRIGEQVWMAENLKVTSFNDGTPIAEWSFGETWYLPDSSQPWFQWALTADLNNVYDEPLPYDFYGAMYNEVVLTSGRLAPEGWRIPTAADFEQLDAALAADGMDVGALRVEFGWLPAEQNGTDDYGFSALPNGYVGIGGTATGAPVIASWATSELGDGPNTRRVAQIHEEPTILLADHSTYMGAGVRLIRE